MLDLETETDLYKLVGATKTSVFSEDYKKKAKKRLEFLKSIRPPKKTKYISSHHAKGIRYRDKKLPEYLARGYDGFLTIPEVKRISMMDAWGSLKTRPKVCPFCGNKYIPTERSKQSCIPCKPL